MASRSFLYLAFVILTWRIGRVSSITQLPSRLSYFSSCLSFLLVTINDICPLLVYAVKTCYAYCTSFSNVTFHKIQAPVLYTFQEMQPNTGRDCSQFPQCKQIPVTIALSFNQIPDVIVLTFHNATKYQLCSLSLSAMQPNTGYDCTQFQPNSGHDCSDFP